MRLSKSLVPPSLRATIWCTAVTTSKSHRQHLWPSRARAAALPVRMNSFRLAPDIPRLCASRAHSGEHVVPRLIRYGVAKNSLPQIRQSVGRFVLLLLFTSALKSLRHLAEHTLRPFIAFSVPENSFLHAMQILVTRGLRAPLLALCPEINLFPLVGVPPHPHSHKFIESPSLREG